MLVLVSDAVVQVVALFLVAMLVLAVMGRFRKKPDQLAKSRGKCRACGRHRIGKGPCPCGKGG